MSYSNGLLNARSGDVSSNKGEKGERGEPGVGFRLTSDGDFDMQNKKLVNVGEGTSTSDAVNKHQLSTGLSDKVSQSAFNNSVVSLNAIISQKHGNTADIDLKDRYNVVNSKPQAVADFVAHYDNLISYRDAREAFVSRTETLEMKADLNMGDHFVSNVKKAVNIDQAVNKEQMDAELNKKLNTLDAQHLVHKDNPEVSANLDMKNHFIRNVKNPDQENDAASKRYVDTKVSFSASKHDLDFYLPLDGSDKMTGNLDMNDKQIKKLKDPTETTDAVNKKYVDEKIAHANVKPSHTLKNVFQYLMNDVNEWSEEYYVEVDKIDDWQNSPHYWDKKVVYMKPEKTNGNYRYRLGLQMFPIANGEYTIAIETFFNDLKLWEKAEISINSASLYAESYNTKKFHFDAGTIYYTRTIVNFEKRGSAPFQLYYTVHIDKEGSDLDTYPQKYTGICMVAYGVSGHHDDVDSNVYDAHEAFEIDKTKMKMLVPLDMNNQPINNCPTIRRIQNSVNDFFGFLDGKIADGTFKDKSNRPIHFDHNIFIHKVLIFARARSEKKRVTITEVGADKRITLDLSTDCSFHEWVINSQNTNIVSSFTVRPNVENVDIQILYKNC